METIKNVLVAMDLSEMDEKLMAYTKMISELMNLTKIKLVHVVPTDFVHTGRAYGIPEGKSFINIAAANIRETTQKRADILLKDFKGSYDIEVLEGNTRSALLSYSQENRIDLIIAGRKKVTAGSGVAVKKLARQAKCNFIFVPDVEVSIPNEILVPIDYSKHSAEALFAALLIKTNHPSVTIRAAHVIKMLASDYYYGLDRNEDFIQSHIEENKKEFKNFINQYNIPEDMITTEFLEDHKDSVSNRLSILINEELFDLVIMGAQGHSALSSLVFGSVTERLLHYSDQTPLMVVRTE